jgi:transcription elongation factor GreA-like protein
VGLIARAGEKEYALRRLVEKPEQKDKFEVTCLHEKIILTCIFKKCDGGLRDRWRALVYGNKLTVFVKCGEFLD